MLFPARWPAISFQSSLLEEFTRSLQMQRSSKAIKCDCPAFSAAAKMFRKRHSYRYRKVQFSQVAFLWVVVVKVHRQQHNHLTDTHWFNVLYLDGIKFTYGYIILLKWNHEATCKVDWCWTNWTVLTNFKLELGSRPLWCVVYQPVKTFHAYRRHQHRDEQINIMQTRLRFTTKHLWNSNIPTDVTLTDSQRKFPTKIKPLFLVGMRCWAATESYLEQPGTGFCNGVSRSRF